LLFLVDDNLPDSLIALIHSQGHRAVSARVALKRGAEDVLLWDWAARRSAVLISLDLDFPLVGRRPAPFAVVVLRPRADTVPAIHRLWRQLSAERMNESVHGQIISVGPGRVRARPLP
jgi:predicted nuclease of predicted toxin-antitoxin system